MTDKKFMDTVLLTFRSFMSPREFLENLVIRFFFHLFIYFFF